MAGKIVADTVEAAASNSNVAMDTLVRGSARAWVAWNGTGTLAIIDDFNVSSVTDNSTGDYTVNFSTSMGGTDYAAASLCDDDTSNTVVYSITQQRATARTAAAFRVETAYISDTLTRTNNDLQYCCMAFFENP